MSDTILRVEGLGKQYHLGQTVGYKTLRDSVANLFAAPFRSKEHPKRDPHDLLWALKDISFAVKRGEVIGIIGGNGAGKSTLLKILSRITSPTEGFVEIKGQVGSLLEVGTGFHPELSGKENIYLNGAILGMKKAEVDRKLNDIVEFSGVEQFLDTPVKRYSSGMYVRLAFSVAAHLETEILIVDEVLAVGDDAFQKKCLGKMDELARGGRTVLFVSHNLTAVQRLCPRCILLGRGVLRMDGPSHQVIASYLGGNDAGRAVRTWDDKDRAPGNDSAQLRSVRVLNGFGEVATSVRTDEEFVIEVQYDIRREGPRTGVTAVVFNQLGICVFSSMSNRDQQWHAKAHPIGLYTSVCHVPKSFLSDGEYSLTIILWEANYQLVCREDDVLRFCVVDAGEIRGDYSGGWEGVVRPLLQWNTEKADSVRAPIDRANNR